MKQNALTVGGFKARRRGIATGLLTSALLAGPLLAQETNAGADAVITQVNGLVAVAAAVVGAAVLVVVVPWGAKMAVRAFKSIGGA